MEHGRAPRPVHNPAQPGRITARNDTSDEESGKYYFKFQLNVFGYYLLLRSTADCRSLPATECAGSSDDDEEDAWYVAAEYATDHRRAMDTVEIVKDIWYKAEQFMHQAGSYFNQDTLGKPTTSISSDR